MRMSIVVLCTQTPRGSKKKKLLYFLSRTKIYYYRKHLLATAFPNK